MDADICGRYSAKISRMRMTGRLHIVAASIALVRRGSINGICAKAVRPDPQPSNIMLA